MSHSIHYLLFLGLVVVGPETPLADGLVDILTAKVRMFIPILLLTF
jgi:hypothetical protein